MESSRELVISRNDYITRNVWERPFMFLSLQRWWFVLTAWLKEGHSVPQSLWNTRSPLAYLTTCFVLKIMRTLQAVWVFCLKIPTRGSYEPLWFSGPDSYRARVWFCCFVSRHSCHSGKILHVVRYPLSLGAPHWGQNFDQLFKLRFFLKSWARWQCSFALPQPEQKWNRANNWHMVMVWKTTLHE